jgi:hypothetical protein
MTKPPPPWRNLRYVKATIGQASRRRRTQPSAGFGWRDLRRHLLPSVAERRRRARAELPYLAVATLILNEARDLNEWIEFHLLQGVERFYLYDNGSTDDTVGVLAPYIDRGIVELTTWVGRGRQNEALGDAFSRHREDVRWLAAIDADEFLFCPTGERVVDVLREFEPYPAVAVHWNMFGTADVERRGPGDEVLPTFIRRSDNFGPNSASRHVKSIVDPWCVAEPIPPDPHVRPYLVGFAVDEAGSPVTGPRHWPIRCDRLCINHYWSKSKAESLRKVARQYRPRGTYTQRRMRDLLDPGLNAVEDRRILVVRDRLRGEDR